MTGPISGIHAPESPFLFNETSLRVVPSQRRGLGCQLEDFSLDDAREAMPFLRFPMRVGDSWDVEVRSGAQKFRVVGQETVTVPAGSFEAWRIDVWPVGATEEPEPDLLWSLYYAPTAGAVVLSVNQPGARAPVGAFIDVTVAPLASQRVRAELVLHNSQASGRTQDEVLCPSATWRNPWLLARDFREPPTITPAHIEVRPGKNATFTGRLSSEYYRAEWKYAGLEAQHDRRTGRLKIAVASPGTYAVEHFFTAGGQESPRSVAYATMDTYSNGTLTCPTEPQVTPPRCGPVRFVPGPGAARLSVFWGHETTASCGMFEVVGADGKTVASGSAAFDSLNPLQVPITPTDDGEWSFYWTSGGLFSLPLPGEPAKMQFVVNHMPPSELPKEQSPAPCK